MYGANVALSFACLRLLLRSRWQRKAVELLAYGVYILTLLSPATHATVYNIRSLIAVVVFAEYTGNTNIGLPISLPLVVLITNVFIVR